MIFITIIKNYYYKKKNPDRLLNYVYWCYTGEKLYRQNAENQKKII